MITLAYSILVVSALACLAHIAQSRQFKQGLINIIAGTGLVIGCFGSLAIAFSKLA